MKSSNPVFQILPTSGSGTGQALLAKDLNIVQWTDPSTGIKVGQLGVVNFHTGLTIDDTSTIPAGEMEVYFILGVGTGAAGTAATDIRTSAGQLIQRRRAEYVTVKAITDEVQKVVTVDNFTTLCETEYAVKIEFRNQKSYNLNGFSQFSKTYSYYSGCCPATACDDCDRVGDPGEVAEEIAKLINADPDHLVIASVQAFKASTVVGGTGAGVVVFTVGTTSYSTPSLVTSAGAASAAAMATAINSQVSSPYRASSTGTTLNVFPVSTSGTKPSAGILLTTASGVTVTGGATFNNKADVGSDAAYTATAGAGASLTITGVQQTRTAFNGSIPINYSRNGTDFIVSLRGGLGICNGTVTNVTPLRYPEGQGYDLQYLEFEAAGWLQGPYRQSEVLGLQKGNISYLVNAATNYTQFIFGGEQNSVSGARTYDADNMTIVAVPDTHTTTSAALLALLDKLFDPILGEDIADDTAALTKNVVISALTPITDGILSLS